MILNCLKLRRQYVLVLSFNLVNVLNSPPPPKKKVCCVYIFWYVQKWNELALDNVQERPQVHMS